MKYLVARAALAAALLAGTLGIGLGSAGVPDFSGNSGWLNSSGLSPADLAGKVVLVDFWEYTCINCLRTLPYLKTWNERYKDDGLVIVGVHTPEFGFSGERANVAAAIGQLGVAWPVVLDDRNAIWKRYGNDSWPHEYLFDRSGKLVESIVGEGNYPYTEHTIQQLLREGNPSLTFPPVMALLPQDSYVKPGAVCYPKTAETILERSGFANAEANADLTRYARYVDLGNHVDGGVYVDGQWHMADDAAVLDSGGGSAAMLYHAIQVVAVLGVERGKHVRVDVTQDGAPLAKGDAGSDVQFDAAGKSYLDVAADRAYDVVDNAVYGHHELRLTAKDSGLNLYSFAFESCATGT